MNAVEKLQALLTAANSTTSEADTNLTTAVQALIDGYGQGDGEGLPDGIAEVSTGTYTPATNEGTWFGKTFSNGMSGPAKWVVMWDEDGVIQDSYDVDTAYSGYGVVTENYKAGYTQGKAINMSNIGSGYIGNLSTTELGTYGGINPAFSDTQFKTAWYSGTSLVAGHTYRWVAGR